MKNLLQTCIIGAAAATMLLAADAYAAAPQRIAVDDEAPLIYCVGALSGNKGVYTITSEGGFTEDKISGDTYVQWSFIGSGGTFTSKEKAVGTSMPFYGSNYVVMATAQGGADGPWSHSIYAYQGVPATLIATDMAYDAISGNVYGWFRADAFSVGEYNLGIFDVEAKTKTVVGANSQVKLVALACDKDGQLWGIAQNGDLYTVDKTSGALANKGSLGIACTENNQSAAIDPATGKMYWATAGTYAGGLYEVNTTACTATKIYDFPTGKRFNGLYIPAPEANPAAPAAPIDLKAVYSGTGNDMTVSFKAPVKTHGGDPLSGNITYTIEIDGNSASTGTMQAGADLSKTITTTYGAHTVSAFLSNSYGDSPAESVKLFVGYDEPSPLANVKAELDGSNVTVSWTAPGGANGGDVNPAMLKYDVVRNPGNVAVATGTTSTSVTDRLPEGHIKDYSYTVTVYYDGAVSSEATSNDVSYGEPYAIPYTENFNSISAIGQEGCKVINATNNPDMTWKLTEQDGNKFIQFSGDGVTSHKNYFFTAPISMIGGTKYKLTFELRNNSTTYGSGMRVNLSKSQSENTNDYIYPWIIPNIGVKTSEEYVNKWVEYSAEFTPQETGVFSICFFDQGYSWYNYTIDLDNIRVFDPTMVGVEGIASDSDALNVATEGGRIEASAPGMEITVFSTDGRIVAKGLDRISAEPGRGLFIVKAGAASAKVIL